MSKKVVLVIGAGDATGGAIARRFAREGYAAVIVRRDADKLTELAGQIRADGGEVHPFGVDARKEDQIVDLFAKVEAGIGPLEAVVFNIGANVNFPIVETTARVYTKVWEGIHVAHPIIDGAIDTAWIAENFPQRYALKDQDGILNPDHIADAYWALHSQPRDAWTHELDLRPWMETF